MYDAVTRNTYATLIKTTEANLPPQVNAALVKVAARLPAVRDAMLRTAKEKR